MITPLGRFVEGARRQDAGGRRVSPPSEVPRQEGEYRRRLVPSCRTRARVSFCLCRLVPRRCCQWGCSLGRVAHQAHGDPSAGRLPVQATPLRCALGCRSLHSSLIPVAAAWTVPRVTLLGPSASRLFRWPQRRLHRSARWLRTRPDHLGLPRQGRATALRGHSAAWALCCVPPPVTGPHAEVVGAGPH